tara:strand:+ start:8174 stop:10648 length:2475 start_codon:yes stop_codon:yes gene_type:complete
MQSMHNNWRKFLNEGTFKGASADTRLLREIDEDELGHIQRALDEMGPEDLAFNELFGGKNRVLIPFPVADTKSELGRFVNIVNPPAEKRVAYDGNPWIADFQAGLMTRNKPLSDREMTQDLEAVAFGNLGSPQLGPQRVERKKESMKIGKWLAAVERALKGLAEWHKIWQSGDEKAMDAHEKTWEGKTRPMLLKLLGVSRYGQLDKRFMLNDTDHYADEKILKVIADLRKYWQQNADYIKKNSEGIKKSGAYYIIITRHPIDVLRMSDFDDIYSCHSPPSHHSQAGESYYRCAVAEAHGHGAVAYAVNGDDLEEAYETMPGYPLDDPLEFNDIEDFQEGEIFSDDKRSEGLIEPVSRLRLRQVRYYEDRSGNDTDDDGVQLAIPEDRVYGKKIPGFRETIFDWARENQKEAISDTPLKKNRAFMGGEKLGVDLGKFVKFGGSYEDNQIDVLIPHFLGMVGFGSAQQDTETEDQLDASLIGGTAEQLEEAANNVLREYGTFGDSDKEFKVSFDVEDDYDGGFYINPNVVLLLRWPSDEWKTLPDFQTMRYLPHEFDDYGYSFLDPKHTTVHTYRDNDKIIIELRIQNELLDPNDNYVYDSAESFEEFLDHVHDLSRDGRTLEGIRQLTERFLKREGAMDGGVVIQLGQDIQNDEFTSYEWDIEVSEGYELDEFELISANTDVAVSYKGTTLEVAKKILGSRDFWIKLREQMHIEPQKIAQEDYYVPIDRTALDVIEQDSIIVYRLNYHIGDDMPDGQIEVFKELIEFWDDEGEIQAVMQKVFNSFVQEAGALKQVSPYLDVNRVDESKKVSGQQLFNNWRRFLNQ